MKFMKKTFMFGAVVVIVGIILTIIGWGLHGNQNLDKILQNEYNKGYHVEKYSRNFNNQNINNLKINSALPVHLTSGNQFRTVVKSDKRNITQINPKNGQLIIKSKLAQSNTNLHGFFKKFKLSGNGYANGSYINVTIPKQNTLNSIQQINNTGDIKMDNINSKNILLNSSTSNMKLHNIKSNHLIKLSNSDGDISLNQVNAPNLSTSGNSGDINISNSKFNKANSDIHNNSGNINLNNNEWTELNGYNESGNIDFNQQYIQNNFRLNNELGNIEGIVHPKKNIMINTKNNSGNTHVYNHHTDTNQIKNYTFINNYGNINISK